MKRDISDNDLKNLLEEKYLKYNTTHFIDSDPVQIPHRFTEKNDIEDFSIFNFNYFMG